MKVALWPYRFEPTDGGCRVTESWSDERNALVKALGKPVSDVADRPAHNRAGMEQTQANLKAAAQASPEVGRARRDDPAPGRRFPGEKVQRRDDGTGSTGVGSSRRSPAPEEPGQRDLDDMMAREPSCAVTVEDCLEEIASRPWGIRDADPCRGDSVVSIAADEVIRTSASDRALVEAHQQGDPEAFPTIVANYYGMLLTQAFRRMGSRAEAEDVVQEVFERAFRSFDRFGGDCRIAPWLSRITSNVCADHGSRRSANVELGRRVSPRDAVDSTDVGESISDPAVLASVRTAIDALPASQRQTFVLHEVGGLSYSQVADQLGISEDNARARVHRAKSTLRSKLDGVRGTLGGILALPAVTKGLAHRWPGRPGHGGAGGDLPVPSLMLHSSPSVG